MITWRRFLLPGWISARAGNPRPISKIFSPGWKCSSRAGRMKKPHVIAAKFQPGLKHEFEQAHWRNIQRNKMAAMEKSCLNPGWNSPCNRNKMSARGASWNLSPGWNSPCNHPLRHVCPCVNIHSLLAAASWKSSTSQQIFSASYLKN